MPTLTGDTLPVPFGAVSLAVPGVFVFPYEISPSPSWETEVGIGQKTVTGFTATFGTPAPSNAEFGYVVEEM